MALRPSMATFSRALRAPVSLPPLQAVKPRLPPQTLQPPNFSAVRGIRTNPYRGGLNASNQAKSSSEGGGSLFSLSAPHGAPSADAPKSFSAPGGWQRTLTSLGLIGGTALAANLFLNREQREGPLDQYARSYLNSTFKYLAGGLTMTAGAAIGLHRMGFTHRLMMANPWVVLGGGLVASIGSMIGVQTLEPGSPGKYLCWALFNASQAAVLSPLL